MLQRAGLLLALVFVAGEASAQLSAQPVEYDCKIIASTDQFPEGILASPSMNAHGRVAFQAFIGPGSTELRSGDVPETILTAASERAADMIVMTTNGRDTLGQVLRGSTTERVLRAAKCPVLAVPERA